MLPQSVQHFKVYLSLLTSEEPLLSLPVIVCVPAPDTYMPVCPLEVLLQRCLSTQCGLLQLVLLLLLQLSTCQVMLVFHGVMVRCICTLRCLTVSSSCLSCHVCMSWCNATAAFMQRSPPSHISKKHHHVIQCSSLAPTMPALQPVY